MSKIHRMVQLLGWFSRSSTYTLKKHLRDCCSQQLCDGTSSPRERDEQVGVGAGGSTGHDGDDGGREDGRDTGRGGDNSGGADGGDTRHGGDDGGRADGGDTGHGGDDGGREDGGDIGRGGNDGGRAGGGEGAPGEAGRHDVPGREDGGGDGEGPHRRLPQRALLLRHTPRDAGEEPLVRGAGRLALHHRPAHTCRVPERQEVRDGLRRSPSSRVHGCEERGRRLRCVASERIPSDSSSAQTATNTNT